ncbi:MAG: choice-of-anchor D domain-containing protein [Ignavibacteria bacterium]|nr:choice-of-anchor D domain-containing protein [Ignavibacteria bacterium]
MKFLAKVLVVLFSSTLALSAQTHDAKTEAIINKLKISTMTLNASAQGKEYWLAVPLNEGKTQPTLNLEFYVTSSYNTVITLEVPGAGFIATKKIKALEVATFSTLNASANYDWEVVSSQTPDNRGIHIFADKPISVYCLNGKQVTSDGYLGLPISSWGTDYIHCAYYDFNEYRPLGAGFIVIASEDQTAVTINLKGRGKLFAKTRSGSKIGEILKVTLDKGQVYNVVGDATTIGQFDLTGSKIHADKPIGVISYHERTLLPQNSQNGRDHMVEMVPPVSAWGKKYVNLEFIRDNHGDFFRIVASKNNTYWKMKYYDKMTGDLISQREGKLNDGEFYEDFNEWAGRGAIEGIRGVSVWEADKPVFLMQYQYSANWDRGDNFDPDMVVVTPYEQYLKGTLFQTPSNPAFINNWFNYVVEGDPLDTTSRKLKSLVIDGDSVYKSYPQLLLNRIPTTNLYWGFKFMSPGPHIVTSDTKFGGYVYGFGSFNGYTWPAALATRSLEDLDTLPPVLIFDTECGDYKYTSTEVRNFGTPPDTVQIDQGIFEISLIDSLSYNYELIFKTASTIIPLPKVTEFKFDLIVKDKTKDAFAVFIVMDRAGNYTIDTVSYIVDRLELDPKIVKFGSVRIGTTKSLTVKIVNPNNKTVKVKKLSLLKKKEYVITSGEIPPEIDLIAKGTHDITIAYTPIKEGLKEDDDNQLDIDSIQVETECAKFTFPVKGRGVVPCADVEPLWLAATTAVGDTVRKEISGRALYIRNKGTDTLTVKGLLGVQLPFFVENTNPPFPFKVAPGGERLFTSIGYAPTQITADTIKVTFETDGAGANCNEISTWIGRGKAPGPKITSYDWKERRVLTDNNSTIEVPNLGTSDLNLIGWKFSNPTDPNFKATTQTTFSPTAPFLVRANNQTKVVFDVVYTPSDEATHHNSIIPEFRETVPQIEGMLDGIGILPKIVPTGWVFPDSTLIGDTYATPGSVVIRNPSTSAVLNVKTFAIRAGGDINDFAFTKTLPTSFIIPKADSMVFPVNFTPTAIGKRKITIDMTSDAMTGPEVDPTVSNSVDVEGVGYQIITNFPGITVTSIPYGVWMTCDTSSKNFVINNPGTANLVIDNYAVVGPDAANFLMTFPTLPLVIRPNSPVAIPVKFAPNANRPFSAQVLIYSNADTVVYPLAQRTASLDGIGKIVPVEFSLTVKGAKSIEPGTIQTLVLSAVSGDFTDAGMVDFTAEISFHEKYMKYEGTKFVGAYGVNNAWKFTADSAKDRSANYKRILVGSGSFPIPAAGPIAELTFQSLLADTIYYPIGLNVQVPNRASCVIPTSTGDQLSILGCFINARLVSPSGSKYALTSISPNPSSNNVITIDYSVGLTSHTTFELFNSLGERVAVLLDKVLDHGDYQARIGIASIPSGVYSCRMVSGQFSTSQMITITK